MGTFTDVFERKEVKYRLSASQHAAMLGALDGRLMPDAYGFSRIMSLYLDTPDRLLVERSLGKPLYKEKLRLRSYGLPSEQDRVFVEIKKKFDGIVYKRRVGLSYAAARAYLGGMSYEQACARYPLSDFAMAAESVAERSLQIAREIDQFLLAYQPLRASMVIDCERTAYAPVVEGGSGLALREAALRGRRVDAANEMTTTSEATGPAEASRVPDDLRITFDTSIFFGDMFVEAASPTLNPLIKPGEAIMEIKSAGPFPLWLVQALDACEAYPSSFSKYGEAYKAAQRGGTPALAAEPVAVSVEVAAASSPASACSQQFRRSHPALERASAEEASECLAFDARDTRRRRFCTPAPAMKKGGRCA